MEALDTRPFDSYSASDSAETSRKIFRLPIIQPHYAGNDVRKENERDRATLFLGLLILGELPPI